MAKKDSAQKQWIVTTAADRPIREIARDLERAGLSVASVNDEIQSISGRASEGVVEQLRRVSGVVDVSPDTPIDIGPPDAPETW